MSRTLTRNGQTANRRQPLAARASNCAIDDTHYETLLQRIYAEGFGPRGCDKLLGLTSSRNGEGVSTVACCLALYAADHHQLDVLLVDANPVNPQLHKIFGIPPAPGFLNQAVEDDLDPLTGIHQLADVADESWPTALSPFVRSKRIQLRRRLKTETIAAPRLSIIPLGDPELAIGGSIQLTRGEPLHHWKQKFDLVLFDLPPVQSGRALPDSLLDLDGILFVVKAESTPEMVARRCVQRLRSKGAPVVGAVFNQCHQYLPKWIDRRLGE